MPAPVRAVEFHTPAQRGPAEVVDQDALRGAEFEPVGIRRELVEDRVQQRGVERVAGLEPLTPHPVGRQPGHRLLEIPCGPGQYGVGAVVGGDRQARVLVGQALDTVGGGEDGDHPAARRQAAEQPAALGHQQCAVLESEHARDARRRVLPDAVAEHHIRLEAPRLPEPGQAHLHREQGGLGIRRLPERVGIRTIGVENDVQQRLFENAGDRLRAPGQGLGEHRLGVEQLPRHPGVLAALPGEQPGRLRGVMGFAANQTGRRAVVRERAEQLTGGLPRIDHQRGPVFQMRPPDPGGEAHVVEGGVRVRGQPAAVAVGEVHERGGSARRQRQDAEPPTAGFNRGRGRNRLRRSLFEDDVRVGPGESERTDSRDARPVRALPRDGVLDDPHR